MSDRGLYQGVALQAVDEKGRVAMPATFRAAAERNSDLRHILIARHETDPCLVAYDTRWAHEKDEEVEHYRRLAMESGRDVPGYNPRDADRYGTVDQAPYDTAGRFILPGFLARKSKIDRLAFFAGGTRRFSIWSPDVLLATTAPEFEEWRDRCQDMLAQRKEKP